MIRYIRPEDIPVHYGGLSRPSDLQNGPPKPASEFTVKGGEKVNIQIEGIEVHLILSSKSQTFFHFFDPTIRVFDHWEKFCSRNAQRHLQIIKIMCNSQKYSLAFLLS